MSYFKNASGDFVDATGKAVTDPTIRLQIGQSIGGDLNKLQLFNPATAAPPPVLAPTPTHVDSFGNTISGANPAPAPSPTPVQNPAQTTTNSGQPTQPTTTPTQPTTQPNQPATQTFSEFLKDPTNDTVFGVSNGKLTAFSSWNDLLQANGGKAPKIQTFQGLANNPSAKSAPIYKAPQVQTADTGTGQTTTADGTATNGATSGTPLPDTGTNGTNTTGTPTPEDPVKKYVDIYNKASTDLGLPTLKVNIDDTTKKYADLQNEKQDKIQSVNDNPWLDENTRQKSIGSINDRYVAKEQLLTSMLTLYNNQYTQGLNEANTIAGNVITDQRTAADNAQKALENNKKIVLDYGVDKQFYTVDGHTIIRTADGKVYDSYDNWVKDGGGQGVPVQSIGGLMTLKQQHDFQIDLENANTSALNASNNTKNKISYQDINGKTYQITTDPNGNIVSTQPLDQLPGVTSQGSSPYQVQANQRIVQSVDELLPEVNNDTVGLGGKLKSNIPGTSAYNFKSKLDTLKANIAFGALQQMRDASKTGGALGQISDAEERLLSATLGALDVGQSPESFKGQLQKVKDSIGRWDAAVSGLGTGNSSNSGGIIEYPAGSGKQYQTDQNGNFDPNKPLTKAGNASASKTLASALVSKNPSPYGIINGYDITSYATDPNHEKSVYIQYQTLQREKVNPSSSQSIDSYISSRVKNSPVRGADVIKAAKEFNVDPLLMLSLMQVDSTFGTKGKAVRTKNPGNVGNTTSGGTQGFGSWYQGVRAVAQNLSKRRYIKLA